MFSDYDQPRLLLVPSFQLRDSQVAPEDLFLSTSISEMQFVSILIIWESF